MYNKILIPFLLVVSVIASAGAPSLSDLGITDQDVQVLTELANAKVPHGKFKDQPLNTAVRRPLYVIGTGSGYSENLVDKLGNDTVTVANLYHNGEFYVARLPISAVNSVVLLEAPFSNIASHTMLRFVTDADAPVELIAKIESVSGSEKTNIRVQPLEKPIRIKDMVLSIDGAEPRGQGGWKMKDAIAGAYTIAFRMVSVQERFRWFIMEGTQIRQTELNVSRQDAQQVLRKGIETSQTIAWSRGYHLLCANCTNLAIRLVKDTVTYKTRVDGVIASAKQKVQEKLDPALRFLEPLTQFTRFNLGVLGWLGKTKTDLQKEPIFQADMMAVIQDLRAAIMKNDHYSSDEKADLFKNLGIDGDLKLIENPPQFREALAAYKAAVGIQKINAGSLVCAQVYKK